MDNVTVNPDRLLALQVRIYGGRVREWLDKIRTISGQKVVDKAKVATFLRQLLRGNSL